MLLLAGCEKATIDTSSDEKIELSIRKVNAGGAYDKLVTLHGNEYYKVKVTKVDASHIVILHKKGVTQIPFEELPEEIREKYGYSIDKSLTAKKQLENERSIRNEKRDIEREKERQKLIAKAEEKWITTSQYTPEFKAYLDKSKASAGRYSYGHDRNAYTSYGKYYPATVAGYQEGQYKGLTKAQLVERVKQQYRGAIYVKRKVSSR